ncbi:patatin-like phospholipase family protein [Algicola sagamiensis]|uniref:patatin-like phospholipase family protein n=1 Tax=Algicola sagamiensis TaxID=163869 RepID=UPI00037463CE
MTIRDKSTALLLTGGGARAAYQVGVLKAMTTLFPRTRYLPFKIICGTSAGAINATALSCYASCFHLGVKKLEWVWKNFRTHQVYHCSIPGAFGHLIRGFISNMQSDMATTRPHSLFNNAPLRILLNQLVELERIDVNIHKGYLDSIAVTASCYDTRDSITFFQSELRDEWERSRRLGKHTRLTIEHLMASAAIPMVFPSVKVGQDYFGDGSVHQVAPSSPAIHLGAERILIIGVSPPPVEREKVKHRHPSMADISGHLLDTIFADTLDSDLERVERINDTLNILTEKQKEKTILRPIETLCINPKIDIDMVADEYYEYLPTAVRWLLSSIGVKKGAGSSLVSYLLFEKEYTRKLIEIGYQEGIEHLDEIREFLKDS